jgi:hypothetical protein
METTDPHQARRRTLAGLVLTLALALAAFATVATNEAAAGPVCEDTPYGQVCEDLETEPCNPPNCQDPGVHAWPYPIPQTQQCIDALSGDPVPCDQAVITVRVPGATSVTTVPTPDRAPAVDKVQSAKESICSKYTYGPDCRLYPPDM